MIANVIAAAGLLITGMQAQPCAGQDAPSSESAADPIKLTWLSSLKSGIAEAQTSRRPILVVVGGAACPFCRVLEREMELPEAAKELARWTLVKLDVERDADEVRRLAVGPIPALRLLTPAGNSVASRDGAMSAADLALWLSKEHEAAFGAASQDLVGDSLTAVQAVRLVREFRRRDPAIREAAIRRLLPHPQIAAGAVLTAFTDGPLSARLAARELLEAWHAPIAELDPWRLETFSDERMDTLRKWATSIDPAVAALPKELTAEQKQAAIADVTQMLSAAPAEAAAIRERLARIGPPLLPQIYELLQQTESDEARERLTALRYRLVAAEQRVLSWPGGIERLASAATATRYQAVDELSRQATAADEALLLELFSDPEPLVRELSLRALNQIGGAGASGALSKLLDDPDANVRAAVLKQLAESAAAAAVPRVIQFVAKEQDPDLLVHAVRVLREAPSKSSLACLTTLLSHESWRVRAEAAEAIGKATSSRESIPDADKADAYVALVHLLKDADSFVVSRAVEVLGTANLVIAVDPLADVAQHHPDLAPAVVKALTTTTTGGARAQEHLRKFCRHENPKVRAAAVGGLCQVNATDAEAEVAAALTDQEPSVRIAAAAAMFETCERLARSSQYSLVHDRPGSGQTYFIALEQPADETEPKPEPSKPAEPDAQMQAADGDELVQSVRSQFPKWMAGQAPKLSPLLAAASAEEQIAGALALAALAEETQALPALEQALAANPRMLQKIAPALFWLQWEGRKKLYDQLVAAAKDHDSLAVVAAAMAERPDARAAESLWSLLARKEAGGSLAEVVRTALQMLYLGRGYYDLERVSSRLKKPLQAAVKARGGEGPRWQRLVAWSILISLAADEAEALIKTVYDDSAVDPQLRRDALQALLLAQEPKAAQATALAAISTADENFQKIALRFLARGADEAGIVDGSPFDLAEVSPYSGLYAGSRGEIPELPDELKPELLLPLAKSADSEQAAEAGYLLCRLGETQGLPPLLSYWRKQVRRSKSWTELVYQGIAALDDPAQVPVLAEIYAELMKGTEPDYSDLAALYWTIRDMTGPDILALRKRMRDEVGIDNLRDYAPGGRGIPGF